MSDTCDMLTQNGEGCVYKTQYKKITNSDSLINCKNYCYKHSDKIIDNLLKKYKTVQIINGDLEEIYTNQGEPQVSRPLERFYTIITTNIKLNNIDINKLTKYQIKKMMSSNMTITIDVFVNKPINETTNIRILKWGNNFERWITNSDWNISNNKIFITYDIEYNKPFVKNLKNDIFCKSSNLDNQTQFIGKGGFGVVNKIDDVVIKKTNLFDKFGDINNINIKEICFLVSFNHPMISQLKCIQNVSSGENTNLDGNFNIQLQYSGKTLDSATKQVKDNIQYVMYQLLWFFKQLEELDIIHGDIKPSNIVINDDNKITIIDWGSVSLISSTKNICNGTTMFCDPESIKGQTINTKNDLFSLGLTILYVYTQSYIDEDIILEAYNKNLKINTKVIDDIKVRNIVDDMLVLSTNSRESANELFNKNLRFPFPKEFNKYKHSISQIETTVVDKYKFKITEISSINESVEGDTIYYNQDEPERFYRNNMLDLIRNLCVNINCYLNFSLAVYLFDLYLSLSHTENNIVIIKDHKTIAVSVFYISYIMCYTDFSSSIDDKLLVYSGRVYKLDQITQTDKIKLNNDILNILYLLQFNIYKKTFDIDLFSIQTMRTLKVYNSDYYRRSYYKFIIDKLLILHKNTELINSNDSVYIEWFNNMNVQYNNYLMLLNPEGLVEIKKISSNSSDESSDEEVNYGNHNYL